MVMNALSFIQKSGPFSIRYCNKSLSSNGKDMLGGTFKKSKSISSTRGQTPKRLTSFPLRASSSPGQSVSNNHMSPPHDLAAQSHTPENSLARNGHGTLSKDGGREEVSLDRVGSIPTRTQANNTPSSFTTVLEELGVDFLG